MIIKFNIFLKTDIVMSKDYHNFNITELVLLSQEEDYKALEEIIKRVQNNIYVTYYYFNVKKSDVLDLTQEALIRMAKNINKLKNPLVFKSWLNQIVVNLFYDYLRKQNRQPSVLSLYQDEDNMNFKIHPKIVQIEDKKLQKPDEKTLSNELDNVIKLSIANLPEHFRMPIVLRELQGMSYEEIAHSLQTNVGTIKSRIARARLKLQEDLKPYIA